VAYAFAGIRICVVALIADVIYDLVKKNIKNVTAAIVFIVALALLVGLRLSAVMIVLLAGVSALVLGEIRRRKK
jgi:chromate transporter